MRGPIILVQPYLTATLFAINTVSRSEVRESLTSKAMERCEKVMAAPPPETMHERYAMRNTKIELTSKKRLSTCKEYMSMPNEFISA